MIRPAHNQHNLNRVVDAQDPVYRQVMTELRSGLKLTHWMWFIFPQITGLGSSTMTIKYSISSLAEARAYIEHESLWPRLIECTRQVTDINGRTIKRILGPTDCEKFRSSMTLFSLATLENNVFEAALHKYFYGQVDQLTIKILNVLSETGDSAKA